MLFVKFHVNVQCQRKQYENRFYLYLHRMESGTNSVKVMDFLLGLMLDQMLGHLWDHLLDQMLDPLLGL